MITDPRIGKELAGYRIESVIGRGGMGVVYLAEHLRLKRKVALKILAPDLSEDGRFRERFVRESELAASLEHPNVVPIYDAGEAGRDLYIAMRFVAGTDLRSLIEAEGPLSPNRAGSLVTHVAGALDAAHGRGLIHRDVKSANVLIESGEGSLGGQAYLTDFGLTKRPESISGLTDTGQFMGSVEYAAPEQFEGKPLTRQTDVYSLGCVLYECLTGQVPFRRDHEAAVMHAHLREPPPRPTDTQPELPHEIDAVVAKAMAKVPGARFATAGALASAAAQAAGSAGIVPAPAPRRGRRRALLIGAAAAVAAVMAVVAVVLSRSQDHQETRAGSVPRAGGSERAIVRIDPATNRVAARIPVQLGDTASFARGLISAGEGAVWISDGVKRVFKINPAANTLVDTISVDAGNGALATGFGRVWVLGPGGLNARGGTLRRLDPSTNRVVGHSGTFPCCTARIAAGEGAIWLITPGGLYRVDAKSYRVEKLGQQTGQAIAVGDGSVWVLDAVRSVLVKFDPGTGRAIDTVPLPGSPLALAAGEGAVWVIDQDGEQVVKVPADGAGGIETAKVGSSPSTIAVGAHAVWVVNRDDSSVSRIDPLSLDVVTIRIGGAIDEIAVGEGGVWIK